MLVCRPLSELCPSRPTAVSSWAQTAARTSLLCHSNYIIGALGGLGLVCIAVVLRAAVMAGDAESDVNWGLYWKYSSWGSPDTPLRRKPAGCCCATLFCRCHCAATWCGEHYHLANKRAECVLLCLALPGLLSYGVVFPALMGAIVRVVDDTAHALCGSAATLSAADAEWRIFMCTGHGYVPLRLDAGFGLALSSTAVQVCALYLAATSIDVTRRAVRGARPRRWLFNTSDIAWSARRHAVIAAARVQAGAPWHDDEESAAPITPRGSARCAGCSWQCARDWCCGVTDTTSPDSWPEVAVVPVSTDAAAAGTPGRRRR